MLFITLVICSLVHKTNQTDRRNGIFHIIVFIGALFLKGMLPLNNNILCSWYYYFKTERQSVYCLKLVVVCMVLYLLHPVSLLLF